MSSQARRSSSEPSPEDGPRERAAGPDPDVAPSDPEQRLRTLEALQSVRRQLDQTQRTLDAFVAKLSEGADGAEDPEQDSTAA